MQGAIRRHAKVKTLIDYTRVTAPFAGVITKRYADTGSMIQAGTASQTQAMPVVRLSQNSMLRLILPVPESAVPTVHIGQQVEVRVPTLNRTFPGRWRASPARFILHPHHGYRGGRAEPALLLMPGMYAEVDLTLATAQPRARHPGRRGRSPTRPGDGRDRRTTASRYASSPSAWSPRQGGESGAASTTATWW